MHYILGIYNFFRNISLLFIICAYKIFKNHYKNSPDPVLKGFCFPIYSFASFFVQKYIFMLMWSELLIIFFEIMNAGCMKKYEYYVNSMPLNLYNIYMYITICTYINTRIPYNTDHQVVYKQSIFT